MLTLKIRMNFKNMPKHVLIWQLWIYHGFRLSWRLFCLNPSTNCSNFYIAISHNICTYDRFWYFSHNECTVCSLGRHFANKCCLHFTAKEYSEGIPELSDHYDIVPGDFVPLGWRDRTTYRSYSQICFNELRMIIISISKHAPKRSFAVDSL